MAEEMRIRSVGTVRNQQAETVRGPGSRSGTWHERATRDVRREDQVAVIDIDPDLDGIVDGIEEFSHLLVLCWAHLHPPERRPAVKGHPFGRQGLPLTGIFATRSPIRPNPILATVVRLVERTGSTLKVMGLDAVEGTPVIDIKPLTPSDCPAGQLRTAAWLDEAQREFDRLRQESP